MAIISGGNTMMKWAENITSPLDKRNASETRADVPSPADLGFPCYRSTVVPLGIFLRDPDSILGQIQTDKYWFQLLPRDASDSKITISDIPQNEVARSIIASSGGMRHDRYRLFLSEFVVNAWGGNIIVSSDGSMVAEFIRGLQGPLSAEEKQPDIRVVSRLGTNTLDYFGRPDGVQTESLPQEPVADEALKHAIWNAISYVRKVPGYHELALLEDGLRPVFFDHRLANPLYQIPAKLF